MGLSLVVAGLGGSRSEKTAVGLFGTPRCESHRHLPNKPIFIFTPWVSPEHHASPTTTPTFPTETEAQPVSCFSRKRREHRDLRSCFNRKRREHREKRENRIKREKISVRNELQKKLENLYLVAPVLFF